MKSARKHDTKNRHLPGLLRLGAERSFEEMRERQRVASMPGLVAGVYDKWDRLQGQGRSRTADGIAAASVSTALRCV